MLPPEPDKTMRSTIECHFPVWGSVDRQDTARVFPLPSLSLPQNCLKSCFGRPEFACKTAFECLGFSCVAQPSFIGNRNFAFWRNRTEFVLRRSEEVGGWSGRQRRRKCVSGLLIAFNSPSVSPPNPVFGFRFWKRSKIWRAGISAQTQALYTNGEYVLRFRCAQMESAYCVEMDAP